MASSRIRRSATSDRSPSCRAARGSRCVANGENRPRCWRRRPSTRSMHKRNPRCTRLRLACRNLAATGRAFHEGGFQLSRILAQQRQWLGAPTAPANLHAGSFAAATMLRSLPDTRNIERDCEPKCDWHRVLPVRGPFAATRMRASHGDELHFECDQVGHDDVLRHIGEAQAREPYP